MPQKKDMACFDCLLKISATIQQAKANGWDVWVGGARCGRCINHPIKFVPANRIAPKGLEVDPGIELEDPLDYPRTLGLARPTVNLRKPQEL